ncbi:heterokaryon incompatibility protein-domain-containing protein [Podospora appendiculata]|uniref:Heterokaryon incompatibility protein-domain-containing protein n=1 Tax=Podospora appendiculata TaxID=314037 RepID=A0AAE0WZW0_9PEZI|nr:heterokaryon incompatibility protein-domain-containing protein [Podospora appendiculata]
MAAAPPAYHYERMTRLDQVRVLHLAPGGDDDAVSGTLQLVRLGGIPYEALSYEWGQPQKSHAFHLEDGRVIHVTESLHDALRDLRQPRDGPRTVWADGICINQDDAQEVEQQVGNHGRRLSHRLSRGAGASRRWCAHEFLLNNNLIMMCGRTELSHWLLLPSMAELVFNRKLPAYALSGPSEDPNNPSHNSTSPHSSSAPTRSAHPTPATRSTPSSGWVPDWSTWAFGTHAVAYDAKYAAYGTTKPQIRLHASENRLELAGCLVDRLGHLSSPIGPHYCRVHPDDTADRNNTDETLTQVLSRTLTGNLTLAGGIAKTNHRAFFDTHRNLTETSSVAETEVARKFIDAARRKSRSRRLAATAETKLLCAVPEKAERGDWVAMFHGARSLFLVRERPKERTDSLTAMGSRFVLLGPAKGHGIMMHIN